MDVTVAETPTAPTEPTLPDGFGERRCIVDVRGERLDVLQLSTVFPAGSLVEFALRERAARLTRFHHDSFSRVRGIEVDAPSGALLVVSDHEPGTRLSSLLSAAHDMPLPVDGGAARCLIRQLVTAMAAWHQAMPGVTHGAIGPERIVVTPGGRLVLVECVLGAVLEQLRYSREQYWKELRVALPASLSAPIFDARSDVAQIGTVALALLLGRPLTNTDFPQGIGGALDDAALDPPLYKWVLRALQLDSQGSFPSAVHARAGLDEALGKEHPAAERDALRLLVARCLVRSTGSAAGEESTPAAHEETRQLQEPLPTDTLVSAVAGTDLGKRIEAMKAFLHRYPLRAEGQQAAAAPAAREPEPTAKHAAPEPFTPAAEPPAHEAPPSDEGPALGADGIMLGPDLPIADADTHHTHSAPAESLLSRRSASPLPSDWTRRVWIAALVILVAGTLIVALVSFGFPGSAQAESTGALSIVTNPGRAGVVIDGEPRGVTPISVNLSPGEHIVELVTDLGTRRIPVTIEAGSHLSQYLELPRRAEPENPVPPPAAPPPAAAAPVDTRALAGWIAVPAPADVQIFENNRLLGNSRMDRIMLPVGRHELDIQNDTLGYRERRVVQVVPGQLTRVNLEWPTGTLALNAIPWAEAFVDGTSVGETPIGLLHVPIGTHEITFRHPELGERRSFVTVSVGAPAKVGVDLRTK